MVYFLWLKTKTILKLRQRPVIKHTTPRSSVINWYVKSLAEHDKDMGEEKEQMVNWEILSRCLPLSQGAQINESTYCTIHL